MNTVAPNLLLVLSAPSGTGKTTLARMLRNSYPDVHLSISVTTRAPRGTEQEGKDYHFVDVQTFDEMIERDEFLEWAQVHGCHYGSLRSTAKGIAVFDIDVQGGNTIKAKHPEAVLVFILPPSMQELEHRLNARGTDAQEIIHNRLIAARNEIEKGRATYDYLITNDSLENAFHKLQSIVIAECTRRGRVTINL